MHFRTARFCACAAIWVGAACAIAATASAQVPAPLIVGPDRLGSTVTYQFKLSGGPAGNVADVRTLALHWKLGQKVTVTLTPAGQAQAMPLVATRAADSTLMLDNVNADDIEQQRIAAALGFAESLR